MAKNVKKDLTQTVMADFPEFADEVQALPDAAQLNARLASLSRDLNAVSEAKGADEDLRQAKEHSRELGAPYRDAAKALNLKSKFIILTMRNRGYIE